MTNPLELLAFYIILVSGGALALLFAIDTPFNVWGKIEWHIDGLFISVHAVPPRYVEGELHRITDHLLASLNKGFVGNLARSVINVSPENHLAATRLIDCHRQVGAIGLTSHLVSPDFLSCSTRKLLGETINRAFRSGKRPSHTRSELCHLMHIHGGASGFLPVQANNPLHFLFFRNHAVFYSSVGATLPQPSTTEPGMTIDRIFARWSRNRLYFFVCR